VPTEYNYPTTKLRFIERRIPARDVEFQMFGGERKIKILQQWWQEPDTTTGEWKDVPLEME
jgi:hypothetical protein